MIDCAYRGLRGMSLVGSRTFWWYGALCAQLPVTDNLEKDWRWLNNSRNM